MTVTERHQLDGAVLEFPTAIMSDRIRERLRMGQFEQHERRLFATYLRPDDKVLDLGAGAGTVSIAAARIVGTSNVTSVEANPEMIKPLKRNLRRNVGQGATVINAAVVADSDTRKNVRLSVRNAFWAASILARPAPEATEHQVRAMTFSRLVRRAGATAVAMDVEGIERDILAHDLPETVRLLVIELHPGIFGEAVRDDLLARLVKQGFTHPEILENRDVYVLRR